MKQTIYISDILGNLQSKQLKEQSTYIDRKLQATLIAGKGVGETRFNAGNTCFDIITNKVATPCIIIDKDICNGWYRYSVKYANGNTGILRDKDLILQS